ncbi:hypothetical protein QC761_0054760 [Podospora bellae-mahoneyi]|uniref:Uncharacterized protein n=1 Tax=Podospora bellae-mahoneyi TaxID=2093777 RepID=A0ABR0FKY0_9PEZI|nr:hypothetical protein QC761_0054760 [Podospora bellae-mahoneyi]
MKHDEALIALAWASFGAGSPSADLTPEVGIELAAAERAQPAAPPQRAKIPIFLNMGKPPVAEGASAASTPLVAPLLSRAHRIWGNETPESRVRVLMDLSLCLSWYNKTTPAQPNKSRTSRIQPTKPKPVPGCPPIPDLVFCCAADAKKATSIVGLGRSRRGRSTCLRSVTKGGRRSNVLSSAVASSIFSDDVKVPRDGPSQSIPVRIVHLLSISSQPIALQPH